MGSDALPPLFRAAGAGNLDEITRLLGSGASANEALDPSGFDDNTKYQLVVGAVSGADYAHYEICGPLSFAIASGQTAAALALLNAGASPRAPSPDQMAPLVVAVREGDTEVARELIDRGASHKAGYETSLLVEAAYRGSLPMVNLLLDAGADPNEAGNEFGETALHCAAREGNAELIALLLSRGASKDVSSEEGTPTEVARALGHLHRLPL
jgi:ankyrin repeat protein